MRLKIKVVVALAVAFLLLPGVSHALTDEQEALVGLKGVLVWIMPLEPEARGLGLNEDQLRTDVELRLRKAGIRVLTKEERTATLGTPALYVGIYTYKTSGIGLIVYSAAVEFKELVTSARQFECPGTLWESRAFGDLGKPPKIREIRRRLGDMVDRFINDYLAANPKK